MKRKIIVIGIIVIIAILILAGILVKNSINEENIKNKDIFDKNIIEPDRIVYRDKEGFYYEFLKNTYEYNQVKDIITKSIKTYTNKGTIVEAEKIEQFHNQSFIEFDYKTASKNYIIPLEENSKQIVIKLEQSGGKICTEKLNNFNKIKNIVKKLSENKEKFALEYKQLISRNSLSTIEYKYLQEFKEINYKIHQVKIENLEQYNLYKRMCNIALDEEITDETFKDNVLILTVSLEPKIDVTVNLGNIKYTYDKLEGVNYQYTVHVLIVNKIVNTDCIYNTDLVDISNKVENENMTIEYNKKIDELDKEIFVSNFEEFLNQYNLSNESITKDKAKEVANKGFEEAKRVVGSYDEKTEEVIENTVHPNNFFTRKSTERDWNSSVSIEAYCYTRTDDMLNGVTIYIDKKLGKVIGAAAFGD